MTSGRTLLALALAVAGAGAVLWFLGRGAAPEAPVDGAQPEERPPPPEPRLAGAVSTPLAPPPPSPPKPPPAPAAPPPDDAKERRARMEKGMREHLDRLGIPEGLAAEAKALGVRTEALRAMLEAEYWLQGYDATTDPVQRELAEEALAAFARRGAEGFLAVTAHVRANPSNVSRVDLLAKATWQPGLEASLLEWLRASTWDRVVTAPARALGSVDTPEVREALRGGLATFSRNATSFAAVAAALADLRDEAAVGSIGEHLRVPQWNMLVPSLLDSLGRIGSDHARQLLVEHVRDPQHGQKAEALAALARIDPARARREAETLLAQSVASAPSEREAAAVRAWLDGARDR